MAKFAPTTICQRIHAVKCYILAFGFLALAARFFNLGTPKSWCKEPSAARKFCKENFDKFDKTGSVCDRPRSGRPPALSTDTLKRAAKLFKAGYEESRVYSKGQPPVKERLYFTSIAQGVKHLPFLAQLCANHNLTAGALLQRMRHAEPSLVRRRLDIKEALSTAHKQARQTEAKKWLKAFARGGEAWLRRFVWLDECTIWCTSLDKANVHVWCDAHDDNAKSVFVARQFAAGAVIQIKSYLVVTMQHGVIMLYPTTGTNDLKRRYVGLCPWLDEYYEVGCLHLGSWMKYLGA